MENDGYQFAVGNWESPWPSEPYLKHRIVLDRMSRTVVAVQERRHRCWTPATEAHRKYIERIILEAYGGVFDDPTELSLMLTNQIPTWAMTAWPWPPERDLVAAEDFDERVVERR